MYGGAKAREWLAKYLLGDKPPALLELAAAEHCGESADAEIERKAAALRTSAVFDRLANSFGAPEPGIE